MVSREKVTEDRVFMCGYVSCGKEFIVKAGERKHKYCSQECAKKQFLHKNPHYGESRKSYKKLVGGKRNGRFCQRCEKIGVKTELMGANRINCPKCWYVLNHDVCDSEAIYT
jgi:hypothetical protein